MAAKVATKSAKPLYTRFVEIGRVVLLRSGPDAGKLATIVDVVDHNRALVDGPANITGVARQVVNFKSLQLTDLKADGFAEVDGKRVRVKASRNARQKALTAVWTKLGLKAKWEASSWGKRVAGKVAAAASTDLQRFTAKLAHRKLMAAARAKVATK